jgi:hypothetical protein
MSHSSLFSFQWSSLSLQLTSLATTIIFYQTYRTLSRINCTFYDFFYLTFAFPIFCIRFITHYHYFLLLFLFYFFIKKFPIFHQDRDFLHQSSSSENKIAFIFSRRRYRSIRVKSSPCICLIKSS